MVMCPHSRQTIVNGANDHMSVIIHNKNIAQIVAVLVPGDIGKMIKFVALEIMLLGWKFSDNKLEATNGRMSWHCGDGRIFRDEKLISKRESLAIKNRVMKLQDSTGLLKIRNRRVGSLLGDFCNRQLGELSADEQSALIEFLGKLDMDLEVDLMKKYLIE